jgi:hypothetical protein
MDPFAFAVFFCVALFAIFGSIRIKGPSPAECVTYIDTSGLDRYELLLRLWRGSRAIVPTPWDEMAAREALSKGRIGSLLGRRIDTDFMDLTDDGKLSFRPFSEIVDEMRRGVPIPPDFNCLPDELELSMFEMCYGYSPWTIDEMLQMLPRDGTKYSVHVIRSDPPIFKAVPYVQ